MIFKYKLALPMLYFKQIKLIRIIITLQLKFGFITLAI